MTSKVLTITEAERQLEAARQRVRRARAAEARLRRALEVTDRKLSAQRKICLGAALLRAVEAHPRHVDGLRRMVLPFVTRDTDKAALRGTVFDLSEGEEATAHDLAAAESNEGV